MMGQAGGQVPVLVLKEGTRRERGKGAQANNIAAAKAIAEAVRSTLGPKGMDKMLVDSMGDVVISNDGVTILKEIDVEHPAAKMLVEVAKTQDEHCGDGTTTAVILAGELLKKAEELINQNVHPTTIVSGYRIAAKKATEALTNLAEDIDIDDEKTLRLIGQTAMMGKSASELRGLLAKVAVKAIKAILEEEDGRRIADLDNVQVTKKQGGSIEDTEMIEGIIVDKEKVHAGMPRIVKNAKIALINSAFEVKKTEVDAKIQIKDPSQLNQFLAEEEKMLRDMVERIKKSGATGVFCQKGIDDLAQHYLAKEGIYAVRRVKKSDMEKLSKATGARIVTRLEDLSKEDLGKSKLIEEKKIAEDKMTFVTGCKNPKAVSILVRGGTEHVVDEVERSLHDALSVIGVTAEDSKMLTGAGSAAMEVAKALREHAPKAKGREQMAIEAFADSLETIPRTLAENAGMDPIDTLMALKEAHDKGKTTHGVNVLTGKVGDMSKDVIEPFRVDNQEILSAIEAAVMILRIDDVIASKEMEKPPAGAPPGAPPGGMPPGGMPPGY